MSLYYNQLVKLKKEIGAISQARKKKRWKPNQKIMIDFINGVTSKAIFNINGEKITLFLGDENKGFIHILKNHYKPNDLEALDIINIAEVAQKGLKLANEGVSNSNLKVYMNLKNQKEHRLVLREEHDGSWVVTLYRKT